MALLNASLLAYLVNLSVANIELGQSSWLQSDDVIGRQTLLGSTAVWGTALGAFNVVMVVLFSWMWKSSWRWIFVVPILGLGWGQAHALVILHQRAIPESSPAMAAAPQLLDHPVHGFVTILVALAMLALGAAFHVTARENARRTHWRTHSKFYFPASSAPPMTGERKLMPG